MSSEYNSTDVSFWLREIETKGSDAVSSMLVSKLGTPEAKAIQMAMVEYHKGQDVKANKVKKTEQRKQDFAHTEAADTGRKTYLIACSALLVASIALIISVIGFIK